MKIALYSHDTFGLGHLRRCLKLAYALRERLGSPRGLLITGSPWTGMFDPPAGFAYAPLPAVVKVGPNRYAPREGAASLDDLLCARRAAIVAALEALQPDLLVVDNVPCGLAGELVAALQSARLRRPPRLVAALRDIVDSETVVKEQWRRDGVYELLEQLYDEIWVFGSKTVWDVRRRYELSESAARKLVYCGYLGAGGGPIRRLPRDRSRLRVLLTGGGGADAGLLVEAYVKVLHLLRPAVASHIVLGPDHPMSARQLRSALSGFDAEVTQFCEDVPAAIARADVVISMAGYNTVCEILEAGRPAVLVPRVWPREEQWLRARGLAASGYVEALHPDRLSPTMLWDAVETALALRPPPAQQTRGAAVAAERAARLLGKGHHAT